MLGGMEGDFDMQLIGSFLSCASKGDRVGLNQMLRKGTPPDVQDYDKRTALHLAASEGHASIVELLIHYKANVNLQDRWQRTPLGDARLYGHRDICRILEVNGGMDSVNDQSLTFPNERGLNEVNIDISDLKGDNSSVIEQGLFGKSVKVKWHGTWVVKTVIERHIQQPVKMILLAKDSKLLRELRHPNILQFLGSVVQGEEMILVTEYLSKGSLRDILTKRVRLDLPTALRYALDIARGMNYLHEHKPNPIVHNNLNPKNLLQDEGGHLKIGEYWVQMFYERIYHNQESCQKSDNSSLHCNPLDDTQEDLCSFAIIFYEMLEGRILFQDIDFNVTPLKFVDLELKFKISRCPVQISELIEKCLKPDPSNRLTFVAVIQTLEEVSTSLMRLGCPVC